MPITWREVQRDLRFTGDRSDASLAIPAGAYYLRFQYDRWTAERTLLDRKRLAEASYNCGRGCVLRGQKAAQGANDWDSISPYLPQETQDYPIRVEYWHNKMIEAGERM